LFKRGRPDLRITVDDGLAFAHATGDVSSGVQLLAAHGQYELSRGELDVAPALPWPGRSASVGL